MKKIIRKSVILFALSLILGVMMSVSVAFASEVYIGGEIIGFSLPYEGVRVVSVNTVETQDGAKSLKNVFIKGDRIISIDGVAIKKVGDIKVIKKIRFELLL